MLIWFLAILCFGLLGSGGQVQGAIKMAISLVGLLLAMLLAVPLGPLLKPVLPLLGLGHPVWSWCVPPLIVFIIIVLVFTSVAQTVGHKVWVWYAYKAPDDERLYWERMNRRLGICLGVVQGGIYLVLLGLLIYVMGYFSTQVKSAEEGQSFSIGMLNQAATDLKGTGLEKIVNAINPVPQSYYDSADIVGLLFQNPDLRLRLADYPLFLTLGERPDVQAALADKEFMVIMKSPTNNFIEFINHPTVKTFFNHGEWIALGQQVDPKDLLEFLKTEAPKTPKSAKYEAEKILGHWQLDQLASLNAIRKKSDRAVNELKYLQGAMRNLMRDVTFVAGANNQTLLQGSIKDAPDLVRWLTYRPPPNPPQPLRFPTLSPSNTFKLLAKGTWKKDGDEYNVSLENLGEAVATIKDGKLTVTVSSHPLVFFKLD